MSNRILKRCKACSKEFSTPHFHKHQYMCSKECREYLRSGTVYVEGTTLTHRFRNLREDFPNGLRGLIKRYDGTGAVLIIKFDPTNE